MVVTVNAAPAAGADGGNAGGPDAKYKAEYAENLATFVASGITEADYCRTRRIDDGLEPLQVKSK